MSRWIAAAACLLAVHAQAVVFVDADVCVYGGTSGGVVAATTAARMGKSVVLLEPGRHLGGMSASGLGVTDVGPHGRDWIGGLSREFYRRVGQKYGETERVWFEPHVAETVFNELAAESGVRVLFQQTLTGVEKNGARLVALTTSGGVRVRAKMFLDTTYEGDLLAAASVSFTVGREANSQYGETLNGVRTPALIGGRVIDPYVVPGNAASGLIPLLSPGPAAAPGTADDKLQVYNYRLCLTNIAANRAPIDPPANYDPARYEALARYVQSGPAPNKPSGRAEDWVLDDLIDVQTLIPNGKTDINAAAPISTDFIGGNAGWVTATPAQRAVIAKAHEDYIRGLLHFLRTDSRIPVNVRTEMATWGLAKDEFTDNANWPWQLYVREARRMVSDYVMTEKHGNGTVKAPLSVGLAAYWLDSHAYQLLAINGRIMNEGGFFTSSPLWPPAPYPIDFRSLVPKKSECENLAATFCLSATHAAFASLRMEPVFMITSQSAATAAVLAAEGSTAIQDLPYTRLQWHLLAAGQQLGSVPQPPPFDDGTVIVDTEDPSATVTGSWTPLTTLTGFHGANYLSDGNAGKGTKSVLFRPTLPTAGNYKVAITWRFNAGSRASNVPLVITHAAGSESITLNQAQNAPAWFDLGSFPFAAGTSGSLLLSTTGTNNTVIADAVRWSPDPPLATPPTSVGVLATPPEASERGLRPGKVTFYRLGSTASPLSVAYTVSGTATSGSDFAALSGIVTIPAASTTASVVVTPLADALDEVAETITISLVESSTVTAVADFASATVTLHDSPFSEWKAARGVSDPLSDADGDGLPALLEYATGSDPNAPSASPLQASFDSAQLLISLRRSRSASDLSVTLQERLDDAWTDLPSESEFAEAGASDVQTWRFAADAAQRFFRAEVSLVP